MTLPAWSRTLALVALAAVVGIAIGIRVAPMPEPLVLLHCPALRLAVRP